MEKKQARYVFACVCVSAYLQSEDTLGFFAKTSF